MAKTVRRLTGLSAFQLRHYHRLGLLGEVERTEGGWRQYSGAQVEAFQCIATWRAEGLSIPEIRALLVGDGVGLAAAIAQRKGELGRLIQIIDRLEQAASRP